jgi:hypothetical protein
LAYLTLKRTPRCRGVNSRRSFCAQQRARCDAGLSPDRWPRTAQCDGGCLTARSFGRAAGRHVGGCRCPVAMAALRSGGDQHWRRRAEANRCRGLRRPLPGPLGHTAWRHSDKSLTVPAQGQPSSPPSSPCARPHLSHDNPSGCPQAGEAVLGPQVDTPTSDEDHRAGASRQEGSRGGLKLVATRAVQSSWQVTSKHSALSGQQRTAAKDSSRGQQQGTIERDEVMKDWPRRAEVFPQFLPSSGC